MSGVLEAAHVLAWFRETGVFPILHLVAIRRDVYERDPWVASSLLRAFEAAKAACYRDLEETLEGLRYTAPWLDSHIHEVRALMGEDFWPYGLEKNRRALETFLRYLRAERLIDRDLRPEELFAPNALEAD